MESGTHDILMENNGLYSNLVNAQMKQEYDEDNEQDSFESDEETANYYIDVKNKPIKQQISVKVKYLSLCI